MKYRLFYYKVLLSFVFFFLAPLMTGGELPPNTYNEMKASAQEYLKIKILEVKIKAIDHCQGRIFYFVRVLDIYRSQSNIQKSNVITINSWYVNNNDICSGGGPIPPKCLKTGWIGNAYLNSTTQKDKNYNIAAYADSFEQINHKEKTVKRGGDMD